MDESPEVDAVRLCIDANDPDRLHLDIFVADPEPWIRRALELGGTALWRNEEPDDWFQVIADPEGNELCICRSA